MVRRTIIELIHFSFVFVYLRLVEKLISIFIRYAFLGTREVGTRWERGKDSDQLIGQLFRITQFMHKTRDCFE